MTIGTKRVCGGSKAAQTGVAPALEIFSWRLCFPYEFVSSHCPTYLFQAMDPDRGRTASPDHHVCRHGPRYPTLVSCRYLPAELAEQLVIVIDPVCRKAS